MFLKSPLIGALTLILISCFMAIYISTLSRKWISYLIVLLFLGGIIVLFVYICTLISNFKNSIKNSPYWLILRVLLAIIFRALLFFVIWDFKFDRKSLLLSTIYSSSRFLLIITIIIYLIFVLLISIKICQKSKGGLKSKIYGV